jgi:ribonuclease HII
MLTKRISEFINEVGVDEVGRGPGAGPVVAAAVCFPPEYQNEKIKDSKALSARVRDSLDSEIKSSALGWGIGEASAAEVDDLNILNATFLAMERALQEIESKGLKIEFLAIDGNIFRTGRSTPYELIVKGDQKHLAIAAASILAKNYRDSLMGDLSKLYPLYGWESNMGYLSRGHISALKEHGISPYHRKSFLGKII